MRRDDAMEELKRHLHCDTDSKVAKILGMHTSNVSGMRTGNVTIGDALILRLHEKTGWSAQYIRELFKL